MALSDEILADLSAKKSGGGGKLPPPGKGPPPPADDTGGGDAGYGSDEEAAMQDFEDATSPAEKAAALKSFIEICYPQLAAGKE